jgi:hypothetical protein
MSSGDGNDWKKHSVRRVTCAPLLHYLGITDGLQTILKPIKNNDAWDINCDKNFGGVNESHL